MRWSEKTQVHVTNAVHEFKIAFCMPKKRKNVDRSRKFDEYGEVIKNEKSEYVAIRRARCSVIDYAMCNDFEYFGTITFGDDKVNVLDCEGVKDRLLQYFNDYQSKRSSDFKYLICPEFGGKTGRLHFHFLCSGLHKDDLFINEHHHLDVLPWRERFGHIQITRIKGKRLDKVRTAKYCSKYITKDCMPIFKHRYYCSNGLKKPEKSVLETAYARTLDEWLVFNGLEAYSNESYCKCYSLPARVYEDMMRDLCIGQVIGRSGIEKYCTHEIYDLSPWELEVQLKIGV